MSKYVTKLNLTEEFKQNTIWENFFRINFNNTEFWREEFSGFITFLQGEIDNILSKPASWKTTYVHFKKIVSVCKYVSAYFGMYSEIHKNRKDDVATLLGELQRDINRFLDGCCNNSFLIAKFKSLAKGKLTATKKEIHKIWISNFFKDGQDLESKKYYTRLSRKLYGHISTFLENNEQLRTSPRNTIFVPNVNKVILNGIQKDLLTEAKKQAKIAQKDGWLFNITEANTYEIIRECKNRQFRQKVYKKYHKINQSGDFTFKNGEVLKDILYQKHRIAQLMGKDNYAQLVLSKYMMNTPKLAYSYLDKIETTLLPTIENIQKEIITLSQNDNIKELKAWDVLYYLQRLNAKHNACEYAFGDYFCFEDVLPKLISFFEEKFHLSMKMEEFSAVNNKDIICYRVEDKKSKRHGFIFLSPYSNPKKSNCSKVDILNSDTIENNVVTPHIQYIDLLVTKGKNKHSKMSFYEMYTTLHEFGHAFHSFFEPIND